MLRGTAAPKIWGLRTLGFWKLLASCECGKMWHVATSPPFIWTVWMPGKFMWRSRGQRPRSNSPLILSLWTCARSWSLLRCGEFLDACNSLWKATSCALFGCFCWILYAFQISEVVLGRSLLLCVVVAAQRSSSAGGSYLKFFSCEFNGRFWCLQG